MDGPDKAATITVGIVGLGYVGLPLAMLFSSAGIQVIGIDINDKKIEALRNGKSYLTDFSDAEIKGLLGTQHFEPTTFFYRACEADVVILCVPTPLSEYSYPDLSYIQTAAKAITPYLKKGQLVVLESSTFPGTTEEVLLPILQESGLKVGREFYLAYSPERIDPGNKEFTLAQIPKVVSGMTAECLKRIKEVYGQVFQTLVPVSSTKAAEMTKILENSQRFINISFINETNMICAEMGIDLWEVIEAAKTKPYGFTAYYPGPGIGGHCIPVDPLYLQWKAGQYELETRFIELAKVVNGQMPDYIIDRIDKSLKNGKRLSNSKILVIGLTYKKDVNDIRESTSLMILEKLRMMDIQAVYHDPLVPHVRIEGERYESIMLTPENLAMYDCAVILTDHTGLPYDMIVEHSVLVFDTRYSIKEPHANVVRL